MFSEQSSSIYWGKIELTPISFNGVSSIYWGKIELTPISFPYLLGE
jgi:hypothetical protein